MIENISRAKINLPYVGDFYQHTYDTSRDGKTKENLHENIEKDKKRFKELEITIDEKTLIKSYRCSPTVCKYITDKLKIEIQSHNENISEIKFLSDKREIELAIENDNIVKLFF